MIPLDPPRFPVIIPTPSLTDAVKNFRVTEYLSVGAVTTASGVFGYAIAKPRGMRVPSTWFSLGVGFTGALLANAISSQSRLMGYSENDGADGADGLYVSGLDEKPIVEAGEETMEYLAKYTGKNSPP